MGTLAKLNLCLQLGRNLSASFEVFASTSYELENFFKCSSPEEIFDYMRKKEIERDDLMLCNGDDDDDDDGGGGGDVANDVILNNAV